MRTKTELASYLGKASGKTKDCNNAALGSVMRLLSRGCPAAILFAVIAIAVNPVECSAVRSFSHISEESSEILPFRAHFNSLCPVVFPPFTFRVGTPVSHCHPRLIGATPEASGGMPMLGDYVSLKATTGFDPSSPQRPCYNLALCATITTAEPQSILVFSSDETNNNKSSKTLADEGKSFRHISWYLTGLFNSGWLATTNSRYVFIL